MGSVEDGCALRGSERLARVREEGDTPLLVVTSDLEEMVLKVVDEFALLAGGEAVDRRGTRDLRRVVWTCWGDIIRVEDVGHGLRQPSGGLKQSYLWSYQPEASGARASRAVCLLGARRSSARCDA